MHQLSIYAWWDQNSKQGSSLVSAIFLSPVSDC